MRVIQGNNYVSGREKEKEVGKGEEKRNCVRVC